LQIHTPKLPTAGFSPPSASSDVSSSAKKMSAKKRSSSEILGIHTSFRIKIYLTPYPFQQIFRFIEPAEEKNVGWSKVYVIKRSVYAQE
jgi:hypothetical protein